MGFPVFCFGKFISKGLLGVNYSLSLIVSVFRKWCDNILHLIFSGFIKHITSIKQAYNKHITTFAKNLN